jgi:hypothetical protein
MSSRPHIVRSVSLDTDLVLWIEEQAAGENRSVSNFVNTLLGRLRARAGAAPPGIRITRIVPTVPTAAVTPLRKPARGAQPGAVSSKQ